MKIPIKLSEQTKVKYKKNDNGLYSVSVENIIMTDKEGVERIAHIQLANAKIDVDNDEGEIIFEPCAEYNDDDELFSLVIPD